MKLVKSTALALLMLSLGISKTYAETFHSIIISDTKVTSQVENELKDVASRFNYDLSLKNIVLTSKSEDEFFSVFKDLKLKENDAVFVYVNTNSDLLEYSKNHLPVLNFEKNFYFMEDINTAIKKVNPKFLFTVVDINSKAKVNETFEMKKSSFITLKDSEDSKKEVKDTFLKNKGNLFLVGNNGITGESIIRALKYSKNWDSLLNKTAENYFDNSKSGMLSVDFCEDKGNNLELCFSSKNTNKEKENLSISYQIKNTNKNIELEKASYLLSNEPEKINEDSKSNFKEVFSFSTEKLVFLSKPNIKISLKSKDNKNVSFERNIITDLAFVMKKNTPKVIIESKKITEDDIKSNPKLKEFAYSLTYSFENDNDLKSIIYTPNQKFKYRVVSNNDKKSSFKETFYFDEKTLDQFKKEDLNMTILYHFEDGSNSKQLRSIVSDLGFIYTKK
jgi:hypothetical protein